MVPVTDPKLVSQAIVVWTGKGVSSFPSRDEARLVERFDDRAVDLLPTVIRLEEDFYKSDARHRTRDLVEMGELAAKDFRSMHSEITEEAVEALAWCYTYDYK